MWGLGTREGATCEPHARQRQLILGPLPLDDMDNAPQPLSLSFVDQLSPVSLAKLKHLVFLILLVIMDDGWV